MQSSKYANFQVQVSKASNCGSEFAVDPWGTGPSKYAASRPTGHYLLGWSSLWHSLNKHVGPEDEFRMGTK